MKTYICRKLFYNVFYDDDDNGYYSELFNKNGETVFVSDTYDTHNLAATAAIRYAKLTD